MAGKKIWAYAKDKRTEEYVKGIEHKYKLFYIWEAQKMKESSPFEFQHLVFMSTQRLESERKVMHVNAGGFFRYNSGQGVSTPTDGDSDSLSHSLAISALASLKTLNFICGKENISITPITVETEQRVQLTSEGAFNVYVPDLLVTFEDEGYWGTRWGNKLAIEVKHTHGCEAIKYVDFENHCIPIIEVSLNNMTLEQFSETKTPNIRQIEEFYNYLVGVYSKRIFGKILSNPVTVKFFEESIRKSNLEIAKAKSEFEELKENAIKKVKELRSVISEHENSKRELELINQGMSKKLTLQAENVEKLRCELEFEKNKSWFSKLIGR